MAAIRFNVSPGRRLMMLLFTYLLGLVLASVVAQLLIKVGGDARHVAMMRIAAVIQDMLMLVIPAAATAVIVCNNAGALLAVERRPKAFMLIGAILATVVSAPAMSWLININASMTLPSALAGVEETLRQMEASASASVTALFGPHTVPNLVMSLLIVAILAGFSEELFFRGALQRLLQSTRMSPHAAVWITAVIFSTVHFQFFGFVPRLLLGAFFGYLLLWSGSVWVPVAAHIFNNAMFVLLRYITGDGDPQIDPEIIHPVVSVMTSAAVTVVVLWMMWRARVRPCPGGTADVER